MVVFLWVVYVVFQITVQAPLATLPLLSYIACMNGKQRRTLESIFDLPTPTNLAWSDIEALLVGLGFSVKEAAGSRVRFSRNQAVIVVHRPHPRKEAKQYIVRDVRDFLKENGIIP